MKYYKLKPGVGACPCPEQKEILRPGTTKPESWFRDGQLADLLKRGFLVECEAPEGVVATSGPTGPKKPEDMTNAELKSALTEKNIEFPATATKAVLLELLQNAQ